MIKCQMNEHGVAIRGDGFAFAFELPAVPRDHDHIHYAGRHFIVVRVDWHPHDPWPVRIMATELPS